MTRFFDTSALAKRYITEPGTPMVRAALRTQTVIVARVTYAELAASVARAARMAAITGAQRDAILNRLTLDFSRLQVIEQVFWMPDHEDRAILLRQHLQAAQVTRTELFESDAHRKHVTFHDLRATGITWCAVRGDDPLRIKQRAGHKAFSTTEIYIREAENLREGFGEPFPTLPAELAAISDPISAFRPRLPLAPAQFAWIPVEQRGIEPDSIVRNVWHRRDIAHLREAIPPQRVPIPH